MTGQASRKRRRRRRTALHILSVLIIALLAMIIIGNQQAIMIMQTDTLNTLQDMQLEVEAIEPIPESVPEAKTEALTVEERDLICRVVAAEARGCDLQGQMAVAQTIRDRSAAWDMTPEEVVQAPGQYADPYQGDISDSIKLAVANIFDGQMNVLEVPTTHFHAEYLDPSWTSGKVDRGSIGGHRFWY